MKNKLSVLLIPKDSETGEVVKGRCYIRVLDAHENKTAIRHRSGFYLLLNLKPGNATIRVNSQGFLEENRLVSVGQFTGRSFPITEISLKKQDQTDSIIVPLVPTPTIFSATIRGTVTDNNNVPLSGVTVLVETRDERATTDGSGLFEFVLDGLEGDSVQVRLQARMDGYGTKRPGLELVKDEIREVTIVLTPRL